jgi:hypothetical protein
MYIIINKTAKTQKTYEGSWPAMYLEAMISNGDDIIVVSLYSNTIKVPKGTTVSNGIEEIDWIEYPLPLTDIKKHVLTVSLEDIFK